MLTEAGHTHRLSKHPTELTLSILTSGWIYLTFVTVPSTQAKLDNQLVFPPQKPLCWVCIPIEHETSFDARAKEFVMCTHKRKSFPTHWKRTIFVLPAVLTPQTRIERNQTEHKCTSHFLRTCIVFLTQTTFETCANGRTSWPILMQQHRRSVRYLKSHFVGIGILSLNNLTSQHRSL